MDALSNIKMFTHVKADAHATGTIAPNANIDMSDFESVLLDVVLSDKGAAGTLDAKLQHSPDGTTWTDDDGSTGNLKAITQLTANGSAKLHIIRPIARYYKVVFTVAGNAVDAYCAGAGIPKVTLPPV